ncbi:MAG: nitrite reductase/ring-hydroxylating ferredoxin subunit [Verrucomicrobiales bacterium]|jgi:nitrite reductase/ring-hydroxylating ferredoxin subunit
MTMSTQMTSSDSTRTTTTATVGKVSDYEVGDMKMAKVGERRVAVIRTKSGIHALDNACPHQGYGLVTGALADEMVVCQWHNWKFDARTGQCMQGEEDVACHSVTIEDDEIIVSVTEPTIDERRNALWPSLRSGIAANYMGQVARDSARLLEADASPQDILWEAIRHAAPRGEYGPGHDMAMAADCLTIALDRHGDSRALALVQGISGLAEATRARPAHELPPPDASPDFQQAVEDEDITAVRARTLAWLSDGTDPADVRHEFILAASRHHLGYGHGIIYTQKAFELLEHVGWDRAADLLPYVAAGTAWETREDLLPYMRPTMRKIDAADLEVLATATRSPEWSDPTLSDRLLNATEAPIEIAIDAMMAGAGVEGLLDALSIAASRRLLRHDLEVEFLADDDFSWLDITHVLTMTNAVRWAWNVDPGPHAVRLALFATWLLFDSSRAERRHGVPPEASAEPLAGDIGRAVRFKDTQTALNAVAATDFASAGDALVDSALADQSGAFIVVAHQIKLSVAAKIEAEATGSHLPLLAAARYLASPHNERFIARNVIASLDFVQTGKPPQR